MLEITSIEEVKKHTQENRDPRMIFLASDHHFGHANIIEYCERPFRSVEHMHEHLIHNWNSVVTNQDDVWVLGDFAFKGDPWDYFHKLNGKKHLIIGNHDANKTKRLPWQTKEFYKEISYNSKKFVLCHYPIESWNVKEHGSIHVHGHSHGRSKQVPNRYDIGVDVWNYVPVPITYLVEGPGVSNHAHMIPHLGTLREKGVL